MCVQVIAQSALKVRTGLIAREPQLLMSRQWSGCCCYIIRFILKAQSSVLELMNSRPLFIWVVFCLGLYGCQTMDFCYCDCVCHWGWRWGAIAHATCNYTAKHGGLFHPRHRNCAFVKNDFRPPKHISWLLLYHTLQWLCQYSAIALTRRKISKKNIITQ